MRQDSRMKGERPVPMLARARAARFACGTHLLYGRSVGRADADPVQGTRPWAGRPLDPATSRSSRHPLLRMAVRPGPLVRPVSDASLAAGDRASVPASQKAVGTTVLAARLGRVEFMVRDENRPTLLQGNFDQLGSTWITRRPRHAGDRRRPPGARCQIYVSRATRCSRPGDAPTPTFTVVALALRLADHLKKRLTA